VERNRIYEDLTLILFRVQRTGLLVACLLLGLLLIYWKIQVLDHKKYFSLAEANRTRESVVPAPRGLITDRQGVILADNAAGFKASVIREICLDYEQSVREIGGLLQVEPDDLRNRIAKYASLPPFQPVVVKDNLDFREVARIESRRLELPELVVETDPRRYYPFGNLAAHVIGYLQELTPEEMKSGQFGKKNLGDMVGRTGVERQYESDLVGYDGKKAEIVDSQGRARGEISRQEPSPGHDVRLTLDFDLQKKATELLEGREGAIIVLDPRLGEVLALASFPTYDPNKFITRFTPEEWVELINRPDHPLENRAIRGLYAPGSLFKLTLALGALDAGLISEQTTFFCAGSLQLYGRPFSCWKGGGHGVLNLTDGIRHSCNVYFYNVGRRMGIDRIAQSAKLLALGDPTGIDLPGEKEGLIPTPEWSLNTRKTNWQAGETISVSIGQGPLLITPIQIAAQTALVANRGRSVTPHLLRSRQSDGPEGLVERTPDISSPFKTRTFETVIKGMWKSVNEEGTGRGAAVDGLDICGKTGSTQIIGRERAEKLGLKIKTHSWFTGFAPRDEPRVVVTVLVEFGGMGGATAAPLAKELFTLYREKHD
jgi:penicillin-binding protein 2